MDAQVPQPLGLAGIAPEPGPTERPLEGMIGESAGRSTGRRPSRTAADRAGQAAVPEEPGGGHDSEGAPLLEPTVPFEAAITELERIVHDLEGGDLGLEAALKRYERGVALVRECAGQLDAAEARVKVLSLDGEGRPVLTPLQEDGT